MICFILLENASNRSPIGSIPIYLPQNVYGTVSLAVLNWFGAPYTSFSHSVTVMIYSYVLDGI